MLALDPTLVEAEVNLGLAYQSLLEYELAVHHLTKALRDRPNLFAPNLIVGLDYLKLGAPAKATPFLQQAVKLDPCNREPHRGLASSYLGQGNFRAAAEEFGKSRLSIPTNPKRFSNSATTTWSSLPGWPTAGRICTASRPGGTVFSVTYCFSEIVGKARAREYQKALGIDPRQTGLHTSLGQSYLHGGKQEEAEAEFHLELGLDPRTNWPGSAWPRSISQPDKQRQPCKLSTRSGRVLRNF